MVTRGVELIACTKQLCQIVQKVSRSFHLSYTLGYTGLFNTDIHIIPNSLVFVTSTIGALLRLSLFLKRKLSIIITTLNAICLRRQTCNQCIEARIKGLIIVAADALIIWQANLGLRSSHPSRTFEISQAFNLLLCDKS